MLIGTESKLAVEKSCARKLLRKRRAISFDYNNDEHGTFIEEICLCKVAGEKIMKIKEKRL